MKLDIVIPTLNRREKLQTCINSILRSAKSDDVNLIVYFGNQADLDYFAPFFQFSTNVKLLYLQHYRVPDFWNIYLQTMKADALMYLNDDVEIFDDTLDNAMSNFQQRFPDMDGVLGLNQVNLHNVHTVESAFGMIGKKYAERFPYAEVWCPDYARFYADYELWLYAKSIDKFYFCPEAQINHYHPSVNKSWEDATHRAVRTTHLKTDKITFQKRQAQGLLWGKDYQLVN